MQYIISLPKCCFPGTERNNSPGTIITHQTIHIMLRILVTFTPSKIIFPFASGPLYHFSHDTPSSQAFEIGPLLWHHPLQRASPGEVGPAARAIRLLCPDQPVSRADPPYTDGRWRLARNARLSATNSDDGYGDGDARDESHHISSHCADVQRRLVVASWARLRPEAQLIVKAFAVNTYIHTYIHTYSKRQN